MASTSNRSQDASNEGLPRKRRRIDENSETSEKPYPRPLGKKRRPDAYRPNYKPQHRSRRADLSHPNRAAAPDAIASNTDSSNHTESGISITDASKNNKKSKRDRKENPSSRIHSLRKQLARNFLPPPVQAEKERELAALLFDQLRTKTQTESKRNLQRYHFIRFMERQKAQRILKKLHKSRERGDTVDDHGIDLDERIKEAEIDLNYTIYAPLGEKYIGIFSEQDAKTGKNVPKAEKYKGNWKLMKSKDMKLMTDDRKRELQVSSQEAAGILEMNVASVVGSGTLTGLGGELVKPPTWWEVKAAMEYGEEAASADSNKGRSSKLNALRDRDRVVDVGSRPDGAEGKRALVVGLKTGNPDRREDSLHDNGKIDPDHLDSESDADGDIDMINAAVYDEDNDDEDNDDDDTSDGDGGFFEKR